MISTQFDYVCAQTLDEALMLLAQNEDAKILAGGHSLIPAMKLRLAMPPLLIDIARIPDLSYIREEGTQIRIGAMTSHYQIESSDLLKNICPLLPECAGHIGDVQVRNKGTIGGSLAHSDPAGDWPAGCARARYCERFASTNPTAVLVMLTSRCIIRLQDLPSWASRQVSRWMATAHAKTQVSASPGCRRKRTAPPPLNLRLTVRCSTNRQSPARLRRPPKAWK